MGIALINIRFLHGIPKKNYSHEQQVYYKHRFKSL